jgi:hypothetical protein
VGTYTNAKQIENSKETHKVYLEMFDMCTVSYYANVNAIFKIFRMYTAPVSQRKIAFAALEGTVVFRVGTPGLSHILIDKSNGSC